MSDHYQRLIQHVTANAARHPDYGPCDGFGHEGACLECDRLIESGSKAIARLESVQSERDRFKAALKDIVDGRHGALVRAKNLLNAEVSDRHHEKSTITTDASGRF